jgi:hypothetical protein
MTKTSFTSSRSKLETESNLAKNLHKRFKEIFQQYPITINQVKTKRKGNDCQQGHISFFLYFLQSMGK